MQREFGHKMCTLIQNSYCGFVRSIPSFLRDIYVGELPVNGLQRRATGTAHARNGDDARAPLQVRQTFSRNEEDSLQVRVTLLIPVFKCRFREGNICGVDARAVEYMVQSFELL